MLGPFITAPLSPAWWESDRPFQTTFSDNMIDPVTIDWLPVTFTETETETETNWPTDILEPPSTMVTVTTTTIATVETTEEITAETTAEVTLPKLSQSSGLLIYTTSLLLSSTATSTYPKIYPTTSIFTTVPTPPSTVEPTDRKAIDEARWKRFENYLMATVWGLIIMPCLVFFFWKDIWKGGFFNNPQYALEVQWRKWRGQEILIPRREDWIAKGKGKGKDKMKEVRFLTMAEVADGRREGDGVK